MPLTIQERELKFRKFIKLRAQGRKKSAIIRDVGEYDNHFWIFNSFNTSGISEHTFNEWSRIDDEEELFLTTHRPGGRPKMTTNEDDQTLRALALENNWDNFN
jgi:hypothetical protein